MSDQYRQIYGPAEIAGRVEALAVEISEAPRLGELSVLGVLEDGFVFLADLLRAIRTPVRTSFLRYRHRDLGGQTDLSFSTEADLSGRDVVLVEGVLATGVPQEYLVKQLEAQGAARVRLCVLLDKPNKRRTAVEPAWRAFSTNEQYVVGYGLGFQERWRELPFLAALRQPA